MADLHTRITRRVGLAAGVTALLLAYNAYWGLWQYGRPASERARYLPWAAAALAAVALLGAWRGAAFARAVLARRGRWWRLPLEAFLLATLAPLVGVAAVVAAVPPPAWDTAGQFDPELVGMAAVGFAVVYGVPAAAGGALLAAEVWVLVSFWLSPNEALQPTGHGEHPG